MKYAIKGGAIDNLSTDCLIVPIWNKGALSGDAKAVDGASGKAISDLINSGDFAGKLGETQLLFAPSGLSCKRLLLVGAGERKGFSARSCAKMLKSATKAVSKLQASDVHFAVSDSIAKSRDANWLAARIAQEIEDACYKYDRTKSKKSKAIAVRSVSINPIPKAQRKQLENALARGASVGRAINRAKELGNLPGNICTPTFPG